MEDRVENSDGIDIPKKKRSLDLQSLYKSKEGRNDFNNKKILKRKVRLEGGADDDNDGDRERNQKKKKKKSTIASRKEVSVSSFEHTDKKTSKSLDEVYSVGLSSGSGSGDFGKTQLGLSQNFGSSSGTNNGGLDQKLNGISLSLDENVIRIPKRRRGFVRRKKFDGDKVSKLVGQFNVKDGVAHQLSKLSGDSDTPVISSSRVESGSREKSPEVEVKKFDGDQALTSAGQSSEKDGVVGHLGKKSGDSRIVVGSSSRVNSSKFKRKRHFVDLKETKSSRSKGSFAVRNLKEDDGNPVVYNDSSSSRKPRKNRSNRKDLSLDNGSISKEAEPSVGIFDDIQEDDEENLEQNAARMLSSRFDPNFTGFSSDRKDSPLLSINGASSLASSSRDFAGHQMSSMDGLDSASVDAAGRVLRPRKQHKEKGLSRKRRHFYEIISRDLDAYWVLNRRIKVFWPLDQSWYYGLVNDYDPERKLHHVKYDDRDEEWISLQNERFKLLLFPGEVPGKTDTKKTLMGDRHAEGEKGDLATEEDSYVGSYMDSEPIISWLARSTRRIKSSPFGASKKQKTSKSSGVVPPVLSEKIVNAHSSTGDSRTVENKSSNAALPVGFSDAGEEKSVSPQDVKLPIVYFRRRFRQRDQEYSHAPKESHVCRSGSESVNSLAPLWCIDNSGLLKLTIPMIESRRFRFELSCPVTTVMNYAFGAENFWLFHTLLLLQYGTMTSTWPEVHLEMLFVDNIVGLRFFLFKGCLKQAVAFILLVLKVFHQQTEQGKYFNLQMPVTSVRFKLSCVSDLKKQLVFAFYNFSKLESSKWLYLDFKLTRHCLLTKQLPLSHCTYDNIEALQSGSNQLLSTTVCGESSSTKVLRRRVRQGTIQTGASRESICVNMSQSFSSYDESHRQLPAFSLSFTAAPTFFLGLHLKLLMERRVAHISFTDHESMIELEQAENSGSLMVCEGSLVEGCVNTSTVVTPGDSSSTPLKDAACSRWMSCFNPHSQIFQNGNFNIADSSGSQDPADNGTNATAQWKTPLSELDQLSPRSVALDDSSAAKSGSGFHSRFNDISVEIPAFNQGESHVDKRTQATHRSTNLAWNMNDGVIRSPNPTGPRTMWHRNRNSSHPSSHGHFSHVWPDGKAEFYRNGFRSGPKKPRTQVSYTLPFGGCDPSSKHRNQQKKGIAHKRIRRANEKRTMEGSSSSQRNLELLSCDANVLITVGDRGWRESGARIVLELVDRNEWSFSVKLSGITKYSYKAHQFLQPGSTNRYTHAMMWRGGKDWILEFPDRSQWSLFKEMHEECYNRNIRAASVKNIPIPGVRLIEEIDDNGTEVAFVRGCPKYFRQVESDVDMALDPSHILYDMDSDDELMKHQISLETNESGGAEISDELFEKTMDMFEKIAYTQQRDQFTFEEIEELFFEVGPPDVIKRTYEHWRQKRQRKGMPLIRQLQPPLWERYQQQVKDWEAVMTKTNSALSNGCQVKASMIEKPPMFAFCLKPRGLEVPNRGSKQRSQRKLSVSGQINSILGDQDIYHPFGRRINGFAYGDERVISPGHNHEFLEASPSIQSLPRAFSPRDVGSTGYFSMNSDGFERNNHPKLHRTKSKKIGSFLSKDSQPVASYNQRTINNRTGVQRWNTGLPEWSSQNDHQSEGPQRPVLENLDGSVLDEFRLRDASGAAQHALNMAKLKREKAQRLLYRADQAIHKAVVALMTAEAIKASSEDNTTNGDG